jgi:hypothetical protein
MQKVLSVYHAAAVLYTERLSVYHALRACFTDKGESVLDGVRSAYFHVGRLYSCRFIERQYNLVVSLSIRDEGHQAMGTNALSRGGGSKKLLARDRIASPPPSKRDRSNPQPSQA